jgi:hypothetical protein
LEGGADSPTASQLVALVHDTPLRTANVPLDGFGLFTNAQPEPFQRSVNVLCTEPSKEFPTAKQLVVVGHETPLSVDSVAPLAFGLVMIDQVVPFHCSTNELMVPTCVDE